MSSSLEQLAAACQEGNTQAQKQLFDALSSKMMALCLRYMGSREEAEDILQEGFITLFTKIDSYQGAGSFEGWARRIFVNTAISDARMPWGSVRTWRRPAACSRRRPRPCKRWDTAS